MVTLRNPHAVLAALTSRPKDVTQVQVSKTAGPEDPWSRVAKIAKDLRIPLHSGGGASRDRSPRGRDRDGDEGGRGSGNEATVRENPGIGVRDLFQNAAERRGGKGVWLALDTLQDPHNVGAIFRAAAFFGIEGILITSDRSAPLTGTVYDVACGGVDSVPFAMATNLQQAFEIAKEAGLWILGTSEHAHDSLSAIQADRPWLVVMGNEEKGMRRLTEESCDLLCQIPPASGAGVTSLNVSVASGILIHHFMQG